MSKFNRKAARARVRRRIRKKVHGTTERPRLAVHFSNKNVYVQVIDDVEGKTVAAASTAEKGATSVANIESAEKIGVEIANRCKAANIETVVFDRGGHQYHGKVKALADKAREGGLKF